MSERLYGTQAPDRLRKPKHTPEEVAAARARLEARGIEIKSLIADISGRSDVLEDTKMTKAQRIASLGATLDQLVAKGIIESELRDGLKKGLKENPNTYIPATREAISRYSPTAEPAEPADHSGGLQPYPGPEGGQETPGQLGRAEGGTAPGTGWSAQGHRIQPRAELQG